MSQVFAVFPRAGPYSNNRHCNIKVQFINIDLLRKKGNLRLAELGKVVGIKGAENTLLEDSHIKNVILADFNARLPSCLPFPESL